MQFANLFNVQSEIVWHYCAILETNRLISNDIFVIELVVFFQIFFVIRISE